MTKSYHLTQEQAREIRDGLVSALIITPLTSPIEDATNIINSVLDKVLGEQWISVEDRLPQDETPVLARYRQTEYIVAELRWEHPSFEDTYKAFRYWDSPYDDGQVWEWQDITHWMPLTKLYAPGELP